MNGEQLQNPNTANNENPFVQMAQEVGEFDPGRQKVSKWNNTWKSRLEQTLNDPIDEAELEKTQLNESLNNAEWSKQIVKPYVYGIYAAAPEIGKLIDEYADDKDGRGLDNTIKGSINLFSEIYGIKGKITPNVLNNEDYPGTVGFYASNDDNLAAPPTYSIWIGFGEIAKIREMKGSQKAAEELVNTIAHEIWHAKQDEIVRTNNTNHLRRQKYAENYKDYKDADNNRFYTYHDQLTEDEAHVLEYAVSDANKVYQRDKEAFNNNFAACAENKAKILQSIRKQEQRLAEKGI